jgi:serine/alanine adding enzyme
MEVHILNKSDEKAWDEYVLNHPNSTFYHQIGWKNVIEKTYGHKPRYLVAKESDKITGILPLFLLKNIFFGKKLISIPFAPYGGVCADSKEVESILLEEAKKIIDNRSLDYLEIRQLESGEKEFQTNTTYTTLILDLNPNSEIIWKGFRKTMRRYVTKSLENKFQFINNSNNINEFYKVYAQNMRDLGTPAHSHSFFMNILFEFPQNINITMVKQQNKVMATLFLLYFKDSVTYGWGASLKQYLNLNPNYLLFWNSIEYACNKGFNTFDFGRSTLNSGTYFFKQGWGAKPKQLYYKYYLRSQNVMPDNSQLNPKRQKFATLWSNLPVLLANIVGPSLRRNIP